MAFQSTVNYTEALGVAGEFAFDGPQRATPYKLLSASAAYNIVGATAYTVSSEGVAAAGGTGVFAGILVHPKHYASYGTAASGALAATMTLPNYVTAELLRMGEMIVTLPAAAAIGDQVLYNTTTGVISTQAPLVAGTATQSGYTLTVATSTSGNIQVGSVLTIVGGVAATVVALGTGTGGTGTYTVDVTQTVTPAAAIAGNSMPSAGSAFVPNAFVARYTVAGAGLGVVRLTN